MCHDSFLCGTWLNYMWHDAFTYHHMSVTLLTHVSCVMTHSCVWRDSFICGPWLIFLSHVSCVPQQGQLAPLHRWVTLLISMSHVTHVDESCHWRVVCTSVRTTRVPTSRSHVTYIDESRHSCRWHMSLMRSLGSRVAHINESCHSYRWVMSLTCRARLSKDNSCPHINESRHLYWWVKSLI